MKDDFQSFKLMKVDEGEEQVGALQVYNLPQPPSAEPGPDGRATKICLRVPQNRQQLLFHWVWDFFILFFFSFFFQAFDCSAVSF